MVTLRWRIALLLGWMAVFYNIERLDIAGQPTINLAPSVYVVALVIALLPLVPVLKRNTIITLVAGTLFIYVGGSLIIEPERSWYGVYKFRTLAGLFLLLVTAFLSYRVGHALEEFRQAVELLTFANPSSRVRQLHDAEEVVQVEMLGCRRKQRPLSLVLLQADPSALNMTMHRLVNEIQRSMMQRYVLATTAGFLARFLRRTDVIVQDSKPGRLIFVAPETSEEEASAMGRRIARLAEGHLGVASTFSVASFPQQALTFEELLNVAEQRLREEQRGNTTIATPEDELASIVEQHAHEQRALPKAETAHGD